MRHILAFSLLLFLTTTCAQPRPGPTREEVPRQPSATAPPARGTEQEANSEPSKPVVAPTRRPKRRPGPRVQLPAGQAGPKTFPKLSPKMELFRVQPGAGVFSFCLNGSKPALDPLFFQVLIRRGADIYRLDGVQGVAAEEATFSICAAMARDEEAAPLRAGETATVAATWDTRGPVTLTLSVEEVPP